MDVLSCIPRARVLRDSAEISISCPPPGPDRTLAEPRDVRRQVTGLSRLRVFDVTPNQRCLVRTGVRNAGKPTRRCALRGISYDPRVHME